MPSLHIDNEHENDNRQQHTKNKSPCSEHDIGVHTSDAHVPKFVKTLKIRNSHVLRTLRKHKYDGASEREGRGNDT